MTNFLLALLVVPIVHFSNAWTPAVSFVGDHGFARGRDSLASTSFGHCRILSLCAAHDARKRVIGNRLLRPCARTRCALKSFIVNRLKDTRLEMTAGRTTELSSDLASEVHEADRLLTKYDQEQQIFAKQEGEGLGGGISATRWAETYQDRDELRIAVQILSAHAHRVMIGICADDASQGVNALKNWVQRLGLPKGRLHGMDVDGIPINMDNFGAVYIKYNSAGAQPGDAMLNGYAGSFRGVYFNPSLPDGEFRQYAVLPLRLFDSWEERASSGAEAERTAVEALLKPLKATLDALGASVHVKSVDLGRAKVRLVLQGPAEVRFGVEDFLRGSGQLPPGAAIRFEGHEEAEEAAGPE